MGRVDSLVDVPSRRIAKFIIYSGRLSRVPRDFSKERDCKLITAPITQLHADRRIANFITPAAPGDLLCVFTMNIL